MAYKVGFIGLGVMGRKMLDSISTHPDFEPALAWDPDRGAANAARSTHPSLEIAKDAEALFGHALDVVYIASPPATHAQYAVRAAETGHAVFCEKPLGVDVGVSRQMVDTIEATGVLAAVNFNHAAAQDASIIHGMIAGGELAPVRFVDLRLHLPEWPREFQRDARWLASDEQGGFCREILSHWVFLSMRLFGAGRILSADVLRPGDGPETHLNACLEFGGVRAHLSAGVGGAGPVGMEYTIWADAQSARLSSGGGLEIFIDGQWEPIPLDAADDRRGLDQLCALLGGRESRCATLREALSVQTIIESLRIGQVDAGIVTA